MLFLVELLKPLTTVLSIYGNPIWDCISAFLNQYFGLLWHRYMEFIDHSLPVLLGSSDEVAKARGSLETANNLLGDFRSYVCLFSDSMARPTMLSLLIELLSSEQVEPDLPLLLPFDFWVYDWGFYKSS